MLFFLALIFIALLLEKLFGATFSKIIMTSVFASIMGGVTWFVHGMAYSAFPGSLLAFLLGFVFWYCFATFIDFIIRKVFFEKK